MTYRETTDYLFNSYPIFEHVGGSAYKEGLANTHALDQYFGHPHRSYKTIHIAGTNGKGSCSHTLAAILQKAGYKVGLYTSPHLVDFRERIRVNGVCISEKRVIEFVEKHKIFFEPLHPSFFELTTALAFLYFEEQGVDVAVIEVGLGGRLDCTNIVSPILSIITNISLDHTQFLGHTPAAIAGEKGGIIKPGTPVVIGEATSDTRSVFMQIAQERHAPIVFAEDSPIVLSSTPHDGYGRDYLTSCYGNLHGELGGAYQTKNTNTILTALRVLRGELPNARPALSISTTAIGEGMAQVTRLTGLMGRWQVLADKPKTVCDTGHNVGGWQYLAQQIKAQPCHTLRMVFGMVDDKDLDGVMALLPQNSVYYWTQASTKRAVPAERVMAHARNYGLQGRAYPDVATAYEAATKDAGADDFVFIGGSSYIVADLLSLKHF